MNEAMCLPRDQVCNISENMLHLSTVSLQDKSSFILQQTNSCIKEAANAIGKLKSDLRIRKPNHMY